MSRPSEKLAAPVLDVNGETQRGPAQEQQQQQRQQQQQLGQRVRQWYRTYIVELVLRQKPLAPSACGRCIPLRLSGASLVDERRGHAYISNSIRTSRYTVYDFFPKQVLFQFSRLGNFYFLCVGIPQTIPGLSTTGNYTTILPLLFFVLLTVAKEGYDDYKRHRLDKVENSRHAAVLRQSASNVERDGRAARRWLLPSLWSMKAGAAAEEIAPVEDSRSGFCWARTQWRDIKVGDVVRLTRDEDVPADLVLLHADGENGFAYIETMALDGETSLKTKQVSSLLKGCRTIDGISDCRAELVVEDPNADLYRFDGCVKVGDETLPLTLNEIVYRGSTIRNTPTVIGLVVNTGEETKVRMNANRHPKAKKPALEKVTNKIVLTLALYVVLLTTGCSIGYYLWQRSTENLSWYLSGASVRWQEIIIGFAIQFNNVIPLALYVSLEIVRIGQMILLNSDMEMYDEATDTPARCNTNTILEDLGQISYVFSDKTGTLTDNIMKFRKMSIAGVAWLHEVDLEDATRAADAGAAASGPKLPIEGTAPPPSSPLDSPDGAIPEDSELGLASPSSQPRLSSHWRSTGRPDRSRPELSTADLLEFIQLQPRSEFSKKAVEYILALALCHTCLPEVRDGRVEFQAASPDELALITAAKELGILLVQRSSQLITLQVARGDGQETTREDYEILDVIEFSSKRKRMSVIVRRPDGRLWLICKGADSMVLPRLKMAHLAMQKVNEVRKSAEMERELLRKSEHLDASRNSHGGRASATLRRSLGITREKSVSGPKRPAAIRGQSFEAGKLRHSSDARPAARRAFSSHATESLSPQSPSPPHPVPERFSFLYDPSLQDDGEVFGQCFKHLDEFATDGLRTLLFAHKFVDEMDYQAWKKLFLDATTSLVDRQERIEKVGDMIEQNLELLGASAIEDKLQDQVPETIDRLRRANIKIWMLTGDKRETAINIAHSARLCRPESDIFILDSARGDVETQMASIVEDIDVQLESGTRNHTVVVVDGHTLGAIEQSPGASRLFYSLVPTVDSVICCRASPAQKALLVRTIRHSSPGLALRGGTGGTGSNGSSPGSSGLTLAIGDGANDLAMLAEAHVGVGISGREGLQAARVADYSISQFRFLARLLLVHGRWNYVRTARFVLGTFWKEMFFYVGTIAYQWYNGYSGTSLYEAWSLTVLNVLFTSLCTIIPRHVREGPRPGPAARRPGAVRLRPALPRPQRPQVSRLDARRPRRGRAGVVRLLGRLRLLRSVWRPGFVRPGRFGV